MKVAASSLLADGRHRVLGGKGKDRAGGSNLVKRDTSLLIQYLHTNKVLTCHYRITSQP